MGTLASSLSVFLLFWRLCIFAPISSGKNKTMARPLLSPSYEKDNIGNFLVVECGSC